jgi:hypothetical protein
MQALFTVPSRLATGVRPPGLRDIAWTQCRDNGKRLFTPSDNYFSKNLMTQDGR